MTKKELVELVRKMDRLLNHKEHPFSAAYPWATLCLYCDLKDEIEAAING